MGRPARYRSRASAALAVILLLPSAQQERLEVLTGRVRAPMLREPVEIVVSIEGVEEPFLASTRQVTLDQTNLQFRPHILPVLVGTTVVFPNSDYVRHNVFSPTRRAKFNLGIYPRGEVKALTFTHPGVVVVLCNIHPEMEAYIVVKDHPYSALTDSRGRFQIRAPPPGQYKVELWHPRAGLYRRDVVIPPGSLPFLELEMGPELAGAGR